MTTCSLFEIFANPLSAVIEACNSPDPSRGTKAERLILIATSGKKITPRRAKITLDESADYPRMFSRQVSWKPESARFD